MKAKSDPIPIGRGLRIVLTESEDPLSIGAPLNEATERVAQWIEANPQHPRVQDATRWLESVEQLNRRRTVDAKAEKIAERALGLADSHFKGNMPDTVKRVVMQQALEQAEKNVK